MSTYEVGITELRTTIYIVDVDDDDTAREAARARYERADDGDTAGDPNSDVPIVTVNTTPRTTPGDERPQPPRHSSPP